MCSATRRFAARWRRPARKSRISWSRRWRTSFSVVMYRNSLIVEIRLQPLAENREFSVLQLRPFGSIQPVVSRHRAAAPDAEEVADFPLGSIIEESLRVAVRLLGSLEL